MSRDTSIASVASIARYWADASELSDISMGPGAEHNVADLRFCLERCANLLGTIASDGLRLNQNPSAGEVNAEMLEALKEIAQPLDDYEDECKALGQPMDAAWRSLCVGYRDVALAAISRAEACAPEDGWKS